MSDPDGEQRSSPGRRASDTHWINVRENWYRDVWLFAITIIAVIGVLIANGSTGRAESAAQAALNAGIAAKNAALAAQEAIAAVQQQRVDTIRNACEAQNRRHDSAHTTVNRLISKLPPVQRAQAELTLKATLEFVDSVVPHQDCAKVVAAATGGQHRHGANP